MKQFLIKIGKKISCFYFKTEKQLKKMFNNFISKKLDIELYNFKKRYGSDPTEKDVIEIKKDIVMKSGLALVFGLFVAVFLLFQ